MKQRAFIVAGTHSGAGKTTVTLILINELKKNGLRVQPFKAGPDYIDKGYHEQVCNIPSYNLDTWMMGHEGVKRTFFKIAASADISVIEGVMGLFDGKNGGSNDGSTADLAKTLDLPIVLVVDAGGIGGSVAALIYGYKYFDPEIRLAGVIFNRVGSLNHAKVLRDAVADRCDIKVLGYVMRNKSRKIDSRHLGLVTAGESDVTLPGGKATVMSSLTGSDTIDLDAILALLEKKEGNHATLGPTADRCSGKEKKTATSVHICSDSVRIAVARDKAFSFYYQENFDILRQFGAELVFFSPLNDFSLPSGISGIYIGGGYPELYSRELSANRVLRKEIMAFWQKGFPVYAECGGLVYVGKGINGQGGNRHEMTGIFPWVASMRSSRSFIGYREIIVAADCPFLNGGGKIRGHEFHYSEISAQPETIKRAYRFVTDKGGIEREGYVIGNAVASYVHLHFASNPDFAKGIVERCRGMSREGLKEENKSGI